MNCQTRQSSLRRYIGVAMLAAGILALAMSYFATPVSADAPTHGESNDCFGGALSSDPIHCEVFEWAHNEGVIDVDAVYRAGKALYIYLTQADRLDDAALQKMLDKSREIARRTGEYECVLDSLLCGSGVVSASRLDIPGYILPKSSVYQTIEVFPDGAEARRSSPGWQVFQQFWPEAEAGAGGATGTEGDFDISEVDRTNFPTLTGNCNSPLVTGLYADCRRWENHPGLGIASGYADTWNDKAYVYVKAGVGDEAPKTALMNAQPDYYTEDRLVVVAVLHDFEELWRWSLVLDRFANSSGNTLGITHIELGFNTLGGLGKDRKYVFPLEDAPDLTDYIREHEGFADGLRWRLIIQVETLDFEQTVAGLPRLLRQLEIPESAVGLIFEKKHHLAERGYAQLGESLEPSAGNVDLAETGGGLDFGPVSWWVWVSTAVGVLAAAGLVGVFAIRLRATSKRILGQAPSSGRTGGGLCHQAACHLKAWSCGLNYVQRGNAIGCPHLTDRIGWPSPAAGSQAANPQLENGTAYRQLRPSTRVRPTLDFVINRQAQPPMYT